MTYALALVSPIAVVQNNETLQTLDLWERDLSAQSGAVSRVLLIAPIVFSGDDGTVTKPVPEGIRVVDLQTLTDDAQLDTLLESIEVVQLPGGGGWTASADARRVLRAARRVGKPVVLGISSNRARTARMNARKNLLGWLKGWWRSTSIRMSQMYLASRSDGVFVVGEGLRELVTRRNTNIFVGTASWIRSDDIAPPRAMRPDGMLRLGIAARLEAMKGVQVGIEAAQHLRGSGTALSLAIAGAGPEEASLRAQASEAGLDEVVQFIGTMAYPEPFFAWLSEIDLVLLTNLNDEQPRLVFDAIAQGALPICPDTTPYRSLGIPDVLRYRQGDAVALADAIRRADASRADPAVREALLTLAREATIETMHARRADWIRDTVLAEPRH